ncbi:unnamed protein product, partial [Rotaria sordida]
YIIELGATTHLNMNKDIELALRFTTGIKNGDEFFTDLNGFQKGANLRKINAKFFEALNFASSRFSFNVRKLTKW